MGNMRHNAIGANNNHEQLRQGNISLHNLKPNTNILHPYALQVNQSESVITCIQQRSLTFTEVGVQTYYLK